ncbi:Sedlin [Saitoella complicata NRRL Y-17804]|uniref:Sedlin n=1 Tax=Saitoella complicata (strain BCRC 22490 / CBS 7301 / JCM 7358 / NBRC 10748 / NRRL Y-17804) TaxID=698492 RepID=UPI000866B2EF|nr:Sedlin [Saitoella complicata NRRL Y-17804]ODQ55331.1 Sedlin [Saitoella complicata NRRL Y-17804]
MSSLRIASVAVIGKRNQPIYLRTFPAGSHHPDLKYHYLSHTALDIFTERLSPPTSSSHSSSGVQLDAYLGLLYSIEDLSVYGYTTNTGVKFVLTVVVGEEEVVRDVEIKGVFRGVGDAWVGLVCNPFWEEGGKIGPGFENRVRRAVTGR